jgi:transcriptional regulator with XRE-family HTH domain
VRSAPVIAEERDCAWQVLRERDGAFGTRLRLARTRHGLTIRQLAAYLDVDPSTVEHWEANLHALFGRNRAEVNKWLATTEARYSSGDPTAVCAIELRRATAQTGLISNPTDRSHGSERCPESMPFNDRSVSDTANPRENQRRFHAAPVGKQEIGAMRPAAFRERNASQIDSYVLSSNFDGTGASLSNPQQNVAGAAGRDNFLGDYQGAWDDFYPER